jgi:nucleoside phosphorylase
MSAGAMDARSAISTSARLALIVPLSLERQCISANGPNSSAVVDILQSGQGEENAARVARDAVREGATALLSIGVAGGIAEAVNVGDVVIAESVIAERSGDLYHCSKPWVRDLHRLICNQQGVHSGRLLSVGDVLNTRQAKSSAASRYQSIACDMESAAIAEVAASAGVHFAAVRVISDAHCDELPQGVAGWVDDSGNARVTPVLKALLSPAHWRPVYMMTARFRVAQHRLRQLSHDLAAVAYCCPGAQAAAG